MPEPDHLLLLQRTLESQLEEERRLKSKLEMLERETAYYQTQLEVFERMIASTTTALESCLFGDARQRLRIVDRDEGTTLNYDG